MRCPHCPDTTLQMTSRSGVEIDYCPNCRGVWLDRGELDKIIDRAAENEQRQTPPPLTQNQPYGYKDEHRSYGDSHKGHYDPRYPHHKKKKGFLGEFFDFD